MRRNAVLLGVNVDHVATIRQARYRGEATAGLLLPEPDPVGAAREALAGGADGITAHLREDRRHIVDADLGPLRRLTRGRKFNLEMSVAEDVVRAALACCPDQATLVPERRQEVTTEGGLDLSRDRARLARAIARLTRRGISVSLFIDPEPAAVAAARALGARAVELHTGPYALAGGSKRERARLARAARLAAAEGLAVYAGHGLNNENVDGILGIPQIVEVNIGHSIVSRAVFVGMREAVREMKRRLDRGFRRVARG